ncbi:uncharacterized protein LTR77_010573 [Saxophila tyrrhenica]|uniref:Sld7 C-terminal domain-containing protein n=1 Tax=Saxophila tyrrhenica TaxID=1690608 RepID=A0AAV9NZ42_9PEZI|nr:hypothetical protein LTR77_010573 [Saxophila tyrrhenica]
MTTKAHLYLDSEHCLGGLTFGGSDPEGSLPCLDNGASLRFASVVETERIPLYLAIGPSCSVQTDDAALEDWISSVLWSHQDESAWWQTARPDSPLGILVSIEHGGNVQSKNSGPQVTEVLLYASRDTSAASEDDLPGTVGQLFEGGVATPQGTKLCALPLSSHLWHAVQAAEPTPPASPGSADNGVDAVFLPHAVSADEERINEPPVRKRKSATQMLDDATERRRKARRKGGEGVAAAAAAPKSEPSMPSLGHRRSVSHSQALSLHANTLSRSPSVVSSRPPTAATAAPQRSSLSNLADTTTSDIETKNKELISRTVMAGMRLYGLSQKKSRRSLQSGQDSPAVDNSFEDAEKERREAEEFKLIYHQVYRGACVAFRRSICMQDLQSTSGPARDVVDRLLTVFCTDPLVCNESFVDSKAEKLTPGGRKAFGSG